MRLTYKVLYFIVLFLIFGLIVYSITRVFFYDRFSVSGSSMMPTLYDGDNVIVKKYLFGARIYKDFDFSKKSLESFRIRGIRRIYKNDIIVFNNINPYCKDKIEFQINNVYIKRCFGCPGDTILKSDFYFYAYHPELDSTRIIKNRQEKVIGNSNYLIVPAKGSLIKICSSNFNVYKKIIEYETGMTPIMDKKGNIYLNGSVLKEFAFTENYYFLLGDNIENSIDSRHLGFIPEDYIIGIATKSPL